MTQSPVHPPAAQLAAFLAGRLDHAAQAAVEGHVADCPDCLAVLGRLPDDPLARLAREAVQRVGVNENTPLPGRLRLD